MYRKPKPTTELWTYKTYLEWICKFMSLIRSEFDLLEKPNFTTKDYTLHQYQIRVWKQIDLLSPRNNNEKKETIKASLVYVWNFWDNKVFIDWTEEEAKDLAYYIKRGIEAVKMLDDKDLDTNNK